ncbi:MAG: DUF5104 domain-containing protein [Clostridia bacterium]|nr:DUF5104 domain-containing protein [Clostridia bacterium]
MIKKVITFLMIGMIIFLNLIPTYGVSKELTAYPGQSEAADIIVEAIKSDDVDKIASMFNAQSRDGIEDLNQKIERLISEIDGDILIYESSGSYQKDKVDSGYRYSEVGFLIDITTTENKYYCISVGWIKKCSSNSEKVGINHIGLKQQNEDGRVIDLWEDISLPSKQSVRYKNELDLLRDPGAIAYYNWMGYDSVTFTSSDESIATVDSEGFVATKSPGTTTITETLVNTQTGKTVINVYEVNVYLDFVQKIIWYAFFGFLWY